MTKVRNRIVNKEIIRVVFWKLEPTIKFCFSHEAITHQFVCVSQQYPKSKVLPLIIASLNPTFGSCGGRKGEVSKTFPKPGLVKRNLPSLFTSVIDTSRNIVVDSKKL